VYLGIDIGTSSVKALLADEQGAIVAQASDALDVSRPQPGFSEQDPEHWWRATLNAVNSLPPAERAQVRAVGLSGQMHGATLLDRENRPLRPAILWNDGRAAAECLELERREPQSRAITGNIMMPGFTAPKLLWVSRHEPDVFRRTACVLLPKDYVRLKLTGDKVSDMSDASGTAWLNVGQRDWSDAMLAATGLTRAHMPRLVEGSAPSGSISHPMPDASCSCRRSWSPAAAATMQPARWAWVSCAWPGVSVAGHVRRAVRGDGSVSPQSGSGGACILPLPARSLAPDVGDVERSQRARLGGATDRGIRSAAHGRSRAGSAD
jgi:glycerol kinase